jgi:hypothetical protein
MATPSSETKTPEAAMGDDPLARLHKMSTTAGVASQQYVAINNAAVIAALLGVASALALFSPLLLIVPLAGIIVAIVSWRQIANSNGTETGKLLALLGLLLSLLIGGGVLARELADAAHARADAKAMDAVVGQLNAAIKSRNLDAAYNLFDAQFRARVPADQFRLKWVQLQNPEAYGPLQSMTWNGVPPQYEKVEGGDVLLGVIYAAIKFQDSEGRFTFVFRRAAEGWQLDELPEVFPRERPRRAGQPQQ